MLKTKMKNFIVSKPILHKCAKKIKSKLIKKSYKSTTTSIGYDEWIKKREPSVWVKSRVFKHTPTISIVVPTYNTPDKYLAPLIESLINQTYDNWQLCISDASTDAERAKAIVEVARKDSRIVYERNPGLHISDNTNKALKLAKGDYTGLLDHDDTLSIHALYEVAAAINENRKADIIYSDEDKLSDDGSIRTLPFFKPDWSPDLLLGVNYVTHFLVVRKSLMTAVGGLRSKFDGAQDYDLILRLTEKTNEIVHIPKILYHWRMADGSTAKVPGEKKYADSAGRRALAEAVKRRKIVADVVEIPDRPTNYRLRFHLPKKQPKVSVIIPFKDKPELLRQCVDSILTKTTYTNYELILVSNNSVEPETHKLLETYGNDERCKVLVWDHPFNYSALNNYAVSKAAGEYIVLLNNDTEVITPEWLNELIGAAIQPGIGAVGPMLLYPDKKNGIQHAGVILGMKTMAGHVFRHRKLDEWTDFGLPTWPRNYLAITAACLVVSRSKFDEVGGLDEKFIVSGNDVAFCLRLHEAGYRNIYWPFAQLYHYESVSVKSYSGVPGDYEHSLKYYKPYHNSGDPYFNKNLDLMNEQVGIGI